jgi:hypothetical protein
MPLEETHGRQDLMYMWLPVGVFSGLLRTPMRTPAILKTIHKRLVGSLDFDSPTHDEPLEMTKIPMNRLDMYTP